jgi:urease accessory protein
VAAVSLRPSPRASPLMLYTLLQISDSLFPSGAFAHSCGLEGLLANLCEGTISPDTQAQPAADLSRIVESVFTCHLLHCDGLLGLRAHRALRRRAIDEVCAADQTLFAMKAPRELREASVSMGRSFLAEITLVLRNTSLDAWRERVDGTASPGNYSIAFHAAAAAVGITENEALLAWGYQSVAQMAAAFLRLGQLGHRGAQLLLSGLRPVVEQSVTDLISCCPDAPSSFAPLLEIASMRHERQYSRLFRS